jgi:hypothetical protein
MLPGLTHPGNKNAGMNMHIQQNAKKMQNKSMFA